MGYRAQKSDAEFFGFCGMFRFVWVTQCDIITLPGEAPDIADRNPYVSRPFQSAARPDYTVFNAEQCKGLPPHCYARAEAPSLPLRQRLENADRFFAATGADIRHGGPRAFYAEGSDYVQMPPFESFRDAESHAATLGHELVHWTKHRSRLARDMGRVKWGDEGYAREELVAELGAAFLSADLGITPEVREDHAAYIGSWLEVLKNDKRSVFSVAGHAQRAADYLHALQPRQAGTEPERAAA